MLVALSLILFGSIFFLGIVNRTRSLLSGRRGPGYLQTWKDLFRLSRKGAVYSTTTSYIFQIAPTIYFVALFAAISVVPFGTFPALISFDGDFIFFIYVLATGRFFLIIAALDTGSPFEGMGANREALFGTLLEPAFLVLIGSFAMLTGKYSFYEIFNNQIFGSVEAIMMGVLATYILVQFAMIENGRMPVDDPRTHLELTMVHEVMVLDYSGIDLAMIVSTISLKFALFSMLITNFFIDPTWDWYIQSALYTGITVVFAITVGFLESFRARARMRRNPLIIFMLTGLSIMIFFGVLILMNKFSIS